MHKVVGRWNGAVRVVLAALWLGVAGCSPAPDRLVESVEQAFAKAGEPEQDGVRKAVRALREGDRAKALAMLDEVTLSGRLTPAQKETLQTLILDLRARGSVTNAVAGSTAAAP